MRKIFLDNLPKYHNGVDWKKSVGYIIDFIYDEIKGSMEIKKVYYNNIIKILL